MALLYAMLYCVFVTFPYSTLGQVRYLIALITDYAFFLTLPIQFNHFLVNFKRYSNVIKSGIHKGY